ncbi:MAG: hypothetical protein ACKV1O_04615 [Saprospiraceae bacterium]
MKNTRIEILWLTGLALTSIAVSALLTGSNLRFFMPFLGMEFALPPVVFAVALFLCLGFLVFGARAVTARFQNRPANLIFIGFTGIAIVWTALLLMEVSKWNAANERWTAYPPNSRLPSPEVYGPVVTKLIVLLTALILIFITTGLFMIRRKKPDQ